MKCEEGDLLHDQCSVLHHLSSEGRNLNVGVVFAMIPTVSNDYSRGMKYEEGGRLHEDCPVFYHLSGRRQPVRQGECRRDMWWIGKVVVMLLSVRQRD
jgi:hypothetical protein